jgi:hypothetical protein
VVYSFADIANIPSTANEVIALIVMTTKALVTHDVMKTGDETVKV